MRQNTYLVNQNNGLPASRDIEHLLQSIVQGGSLSPNITSPNYIEGAPDVLRGRFCRQSLTHAWWAKQVDDKPVTLALHEVVETKLVSVCLNE